MPGSIVFPDSRRRNMSGPAQSLLLFTPRPNASRVRPLVDALVPLPEQGTLVTAQCPSEYDGAVGC